MFHCCLPASSDILHAQTPSYFELSRDDKTDDAIFEEVDQLKYFELVDSL